MTYNYTNPAFLLLLLLVVMMMAAGVSGGSPPPPPPQQYAYSNSRPPAAATASAPPPPSQQQLQEQQQSGWQTQYPPAGYSSGVQQQQQAYAQQQQNQYRGPVPPGYANAMPPRRPPAGAKGEPQQPQQQQQHYGGYRPQLPPQFARQAPQPFPSDGYDYRGSEPEEAPLSLRLLSRLRTGVAAVRSIIDKARVEGQQAASMIMQQQPGEDAGNFYPGGGRQPFPQQQPYGPGMDMGPPAQGPLSAAPWGAAGARSAFDAATMESQRQYDWGQQDASSFISSAAVESPVVTGAARVWGRIRSLLAPPPQPNDAVESVAMPAPNRQYYSSPEAMAMAQGGRLSGAPPSLSPMGVGGRPAAAGLAQPQERVQPATGPFGGFYPSDSFVDARASPATDSLPAWDSMSSGQQNVEVLQQQQRFQPPGGQPQQQVQRPVSRLAPEPLEVPVSSGPKIFIHGSDIVMIPNPAEFQRKKNLFGRSGSQLLQAFVNFEDTLTTFRTRTGEPSYTTSELLESSNALLPQALNRIRDAVAEQLQQQQQQVEGEEAGAATKGTGSSNSERDSGDLDGAQMGTRRGRSDDGETEQPELREGKEEEEEVVSSGERVVATSSSSSSSSSSAEQAEIELMTKIQAIIAREGGLHMSYVAPATRDMQNGIQLRSGWKEAIVGSAATTSSSSTPKPPSQQQQGGGGTAMGLGSRGVPTYIFSQGYGDVVAQLLLQGGAGGDAAAGRLPPSLRIISNFFRAGPDGTVRAFSKPLVHSNNKNATTAAALMDMPLPERPHAVVLGSAVEDLRMVQGAPGVREVLSIGFVDVGDDFPKKLEQFSKSFDALVIGDGSFGFVRSVLDEILTPRPLHHPQSHTPGLVLQRGGLPPPGASAAAGAGLSPRALDYMDFM